MWEDVGNVGVLRVLRRCLLSSTLTRTAVDLKLWGGLEDRFRTNTGPNMNRSRLGIPWNSDFPII